MHSPEFEGSARIEWRYHHFETWHGHILKSGSEGNVFKAKAEKAKLTNKRYIETTTASNFELRPLTLLPSIFHAGAGHMSQASFEEQQCSHWALISLGGGPLLKQGMKRIGQCLHANGRSLTCRERPFAPSLKIPIVASERCYSSTLWSCYLQQGPAWPCANRDRNLNSKSAAYGQWHRTSNCCHGRF